MSLMIFEYNNDNDLQKLINEYIWEESNNYSAADVNKMKNHVKQKIGIIGDEPLKQTYLLEQFYDEEYSCNIDKSSINLEDLSRGLIPDLRKQFTYEEAIYELLHDRALFPIMKYSRHFSPHILTDIKIRMKVRNGSETLSTSGDLRLGFPYTFFRISPIKK